MRKIFVSVIAALALFGVSVPSAQAADADVHLDVTLFDTAPFTSPLGDCDIAVPEGSDGIAVLDGAVDSGCIESYETESFSFGEFVTCINRVCGDDASSLFLTFWSIDVNGEPATVGVSDLELSDGDQLGFDYTTWVV